MITILVTREHVRTVRTFLVGRGRALRRRLRYDTYEKAFARRRHPRATYIFADLERLTESQRARAAELHDQLGAFPRLNHPRDSLLRPALLDRLHRDRANRFCAYPYPGTGELRPGRWPVFLRGANDHDGARTGLLPDPAALAAAGIHDPADTLVVEFVDTRGPDGLYRKYSAFRIGEAIFPRHLFFSGDWMVKEADHVDAATVREELAYVAGRDHEAELRAVFDSANIRYGRIDYALLDQEPQVWEINTNPMIMSDNSFLKEERRPVQEAVLPRILDAFRSLDRARR